MSLGVATTSLISHKEPRDPTGVVRVNFCDKSTVGQGWHLSTNPFGSYVTPLTKGDLSSMAEVNQINVCQ